ncbi:ATP-dependent DNA helicase RecG [Pacificimonas sp. WHA3]|uniref:Probable DNA 3'-5' helicase RecG n=1 Tax=Pacificimonas pallii TaxID=2827236 RepID=A0ABS6SFT1_9SPHN|nr:ATP-dependent DNA helicase RecG [Pacificimonas pallii]MBV7256908.1 ATP-dependent DNA helicase RecG [Pacificimonas pallii]
MRPELLNPLFAPCDTLDGVGPRLKKQLTKLKIERVVDLAYHLPVQHVPRIPVERLDPAMVGQVVIAEVEVHVIDDGDGRRPTRVRVSDKSGRFASLVYFHDRGYARKILPPGEKRLISGRLDEYGDQLQIVHPDHVVSPQQRGEIPEREPVYALTEGLTNKKLSGLTATALDALPRVDEWADAHFVKSQQWPSWADALRRAHAAEDEVRAKSRLAYDELLANQVALLSIRAASRQRKGRALVGDDRLLAKFRAGLPYRLTGAQERSIAEIIGDLSQDAPMLRLLQGDVGSGKTAVALAAMLRAVEAGGQAAMLAPTELLARQHYATLNDMLLGTGVRCAILTGREKGAKRAAIYAELAAGSIDILVGTHAIFQDAVTYKDLALAVIDEQHRFGVNQRMALTAKAKVPPHLLVMTATPIPRTLTLTQFGEMDESRLDQMPPGREPVETRVISQDRLDDVVESTGRLLESGGRAYWVCPLVEESEVSGELAAAEARFALLKSRFGADVVGMVHGQMQGPDKDAVMAAFAAGNIKLLVATTVIEVGVNVPEATLMVIEQAERFGLAQLHQLRGRVGRGGGRSVCLLLRAPQISETARDRLKLIRGTNDGFEIAEKDLQLRGGGELLGTRQSGEGSYRVAVAEDIMRLADPARADAKLFLEHEGGFATSPRREAMRTLVYLFERDAAVPLLRSG